MACASFTVRDTDAAAAPPPHAVSLTLVLMLLSLLMLTHSQIGFTDHHPGMYADRFTHKNLQTEKGRYNWLGDKYTDPNRDRPGRFKNKQVERPRAPCGGYQRCARGHCMMTNQQWWHQDCHAG